MDQTIIVAFACERKDGEFDFIHAEDKVLLSDLKMVNNALHAGNVVIHYSWYDSITICSQEILTLFRENLQIA